MSAVAIPRPPHARSTSGSASSSRRPLCRRASTPLAPLALITADVLVNFAMSLVGMGILIALGKVLFGLRFSGSWVVVIAVFSFAAFAFFALGYLIASLAPTARVAQTVGMAAFFPLMFLSGAALPRQLMPAKVLAVSDLLPLTHVVKALQASWMGDPLSTRAAELAWLGGFLLVGTLLSVWLFRWE